MMLSISDFRLSSEELSLDPRLLGVILINVFNSIFMCSTYYTHHSQSMSCN